MSNTTSIKNCACKAGEKYCEIRETMCKIEETHEHILNLKTQLGKAGLSEYSGISDYQNPKKKSQIP